METCTSSIMPMQALEQIPVPTASELNEFKDLVNAWIQYDEQIRKLQLAIKERKTKKNALGPTIIAFMQKYKVDALDTKAGNIQCKNYHTTAPINVKGVKQQLLQMQVQGQVITPASLIQQLFSKTEREVVNKTRLRRVIPTVTNSLGLDI